MYIHIDTFLIGFFASSEIELVQSYESAYLHAFNNMFENSFFI